MEQDKTQKLLERYNKACAQKDEMRALYDLAYRLSVPDRNTFSNKETPGVRTDVGLYDSTGVIAAQRFVNHMQASLTPPFKKWIELEAGPLFPIDVAENINRYLETVTDIIFRVIESSNFNVAISEFYQDLAVGTGVLLVKEGKSVDEPIYFISVPIDQVALEGNPYNGKIRAVFRSNCIPVNLIKETWPDAKLSHSLMQDIQNNPSKEVKYIECTYEEEEQIFHDVIITDGNDRIVKRKMSYNPWIVTRWSKRAGEEFGRGVVVQALNDLCMLNMAKELGLKSAQLNAYGVYTVADADVINPNTLILSPAAFIPVSRNAGANGPSIAPLPRAGDFNQQQFMVQELQDQIRQIMLNDRIPLDTGPVRTATEIAARIQSNRIDTESAFGRLMYEFVQPLWQNIIYILDKVGVIELPEELRKINNYSLKINVLSPIAREQSVEEVQNLANTAQLIQSIAGPEAINMGLKVENIAQYIGDLLGVSPSLIRTQEEQQELQQQMQQAQMAQAMAPEVAQADMQNAQVGVM